MGRFRDMQKRRSALSLALLASPSSGRPAFPDGRPGPDAPNFSNEPPGVGTLAADLSTGTEDNGKERGGRKRKRACTG